MKTTVKKFSKKQGRFLTTATLPALPGNLHFVADQHLDSVTWPSVSHGRILSATGKTVADATKSVWANRSELTIRF